MLFFLDNSRCKKITKGFARKNERKNFFKNIFLKGARKDIIVKKIEKST